MSAPENEQVVVLSRFDYRGQFFAFFATENGKYIFCIQRWHTIINLYIFVYIVSPDSHLYDSLVGIWYIIGYVILDNENDTVVGISGLSELLIDSEHICLMAVIGPFLGGSDKECPVAGMCRVIEFSWIVEILHPEGFPVPTGKCRIRAVPPVAGVIVKDDVLSVVNLEIIVSGGKYIGKHLGIEP